MDLRKHINFKTVVRMVTFNEETDKFSVVTENLTERNLTSKGLKIVIPISYSKRSLKDR